MNFTTRYERYIVGNWERFCQTSSQFLNRSLACSLTCCINTFPGPFFSHRIHNFHIKKLTCRYYTTITTLYFGIGHAVLRVEGQNKEDAMSQYLILLAIIPLSCYELAKLFNYKYKNMICGISIGLVVAPVSFALLGFTYIPLIGKLLGLIGLLLYLTHGWVGYLCLIGIGSLELGVQITTLQFVMINVVNGLLLAYVYGLIGYIFFDRKLIKRIPLKYFLLKSFWRSILSIFQNTPLHTNGPDKPKGKGRIISICALITVWANIIFFHFGHSVLGFIFKYAAVAVLFQACSSRAFFIVSTMPIRLLHNDQEECELLWHPNSAGSNSLKFVGWQNNNSEKTFYPRCFKSIGANDFPFFCVTHPPIKYIMFMTLAHSIKKQLCAVSG